MAPVCHSISNPSDFVVAFFARIVSSYLRSCYNGHLRNLVPHDVWVYNLVGPLHHWNIVQYFLVYHATVNVGVSYVVTSPLNHPVASGYLVENIGLVIVQVFP